MAQIREIDVGEVRTRFARGWHCRGLSRTFKDGKPHAVEAFGPKLGVWAAS
ncbi:3-ketosteroid-9-alpha-hydroxylase, partial [Rhodococcus sp. PAE-6]|nr:3-ketosteroid-9-alpha-hydroxylase [Rhodococcus sp. PAE-6]